MSGDTVTSNSSLQFTNDNKHAYAYSGNKEATAVGIEALNFNTNSEYVNAEFTFSGYLFQGDATAGLRGQMIIKFNNVIVQSTISDADSGNMVTPLSIPLIIPPFTTVKVELYANSTTTNYNANVSVVGKVGMPQRVGNLDE